ncbi:MAG: hypothetical protein ACI8UD_002227, partial [Planctomycetota bacterium]
DEDDVRSGFCRSTRVNGLPHAVNKASRKQAHTLRSKD